MSRVSSPHKFPTEEHLQAVIAELLLRMGRTKVEIVHGRLERGKDVIFMHDGGFGEQTFCACVIKNKPITGSANSSSGARGVFHQAEACLDTEYLLSDGSRVLPKMVYVISPYQISTDAVESIAGLLSKHASKVRYIPGAELFDLIRRYWPDFLDQEYGSISSYVEGIRKGSLDQYCPLARLANRYSASVSEQRLVRIYVPQELRRSLYNYASSAPAGIATGSIEPHLKRVLSSGQMELMIYRVSSIGHETKQNLQYLAEISPESKKLFRSIEVAETRCIERVRSTYDAGESVPQLDDLGELEEDYDEDARVVDWSAFEEEELALLESSLRNATQFFLDQLQQGYQLSQSRALDVTAILGDPRFLLTSSIQDLVDSGRTSIRPLSAGHLSFPRNLLEVYSGNIVIVAPAGYGKTSFCRWHALRDAEELAAGRSNAIPIYIPLHRLSKGPIKSFEDAFLGLVGKSTALLNKQVDADSVVRLYLDGLDEISPQSRRDDIVRVALDGSKELPNLQVIITARDYVTSASLARVPKVQLQGFTEESLEQLVSEWFLSTDDRVSSFLNELSDVPEFMEIMKIPLIATLALLLFEQTNHLPASKSKLYEAGIDLFTGGWDAVKEVRRPGEFSQDIKLLASMAIASRCQETGSRDFNSKLVDKVIRSNLSLRGLAKQVLVSELAEGGLIAGDGSRFWFCHLSFQEYLTARAYITDVNTNRIESAIKTFLLGDQWWADVVRFWIALVNDPSTILPWVDQRLNQWALEDEFFPGDRDHDYSSSVTRGRDLIEDWVSEQERSRLVGRGDR